MSKYTRANGHFYMRVKERIGADVDPNWLSQRIKKSIKNGDGFVRLRATMRANKHVYRFSLRNEEYAAIVVMKPVPWPITILTMGMRFRTRAGKSKPAIERRYCE